MVDAICIIGLFIFLGIMMSMGQGYFLIAGFNTLSKAEKEKFDKVGLCKFMGKLMFALAFSMVLQLLSRVFQIKILSHVGFILFFALIAFMLIYLNTTNRFKKII